MHYIVYYDDYISVMTTLWVFGMEMDMTMLQSKQAQDLPLPIHT